MVKQSGDGVEFQKVVQLAGRCSFCPPERAARVPSLEVRLNGKLVGACCEKLRSCRDKARRRARAGETW